MGTKTELSAKCLNCSAEITGDFCMNCGQKTSIKRITFADTFSEFLSSAFAFEGPFMRTMRLLITNPGMVFRGFIQGKRRSYYKPVALFILTTAIYILIRSAINYDPLEGQRISSGNEAIKNKINLASQFMVSNINYIMIFLVFSIGISLKLFFRKQYNLAEYTTVGFYIASLYSWLLIIFMFISKGTGFTQSQVQLLFLLFLIYYSCFSFFRHASFWQHIKFLFTGFLSILLYMILGFGFSYLIVNFKG